MKTLEVKTNSETYLILDLLEGARNVEIDAGFSKDGVIYTDDHLLFMCKSLFTQHFKLPSNGWQLIDEIEACKILGLKGAHDFDNEYIPDGLEVLKSELGLLSENPYLKPAFNPSFVGHSPSNDYSYKMLYKARKEAEKRVFTNPIILKKNECKSI